VFDSLAFKGDIAVRDRNLFRKKTESTYDALIKYPRSSFKKFLEFAGIIYGNCCMRKTVNKGM
jgi:hypothetical protein